MTIPETGLKHRYFTNFFSRLAKLPADTGQVPREFRGSNGMQLPRLFAVPVYYRESAVELPCPSAIPRILAISTNDISGI
jgi:hypothetical protein